MLISSNPEYFADTAVDPPVRGFLHRPPASVSDALVLTHGAGSDAQAPLLVALAQTFSQSGVMVLRCELAFRQRRPHGPPPLDSGERDRKGLKHAIDSVQKLVSGRVFLGGHSYGGRQASILSSEHPDLAAGLILFSYPLHPPRKPNQLRTQHLPKLRTPALFFHGTRDPFGSIEEMETALTLVKARTKLVKVEGSGHDLDATKNNNQAGKPSLATIVLGQFQRFFT